MTAKTVQKLEQILILARRQRMKGAGGPEELVTTMAGEPFASDPFVVGKERVCRRAASDPGGGVAMPGGVA